MIIFILWKEKCYFLEISVHLTNYNSFSNFNIITQKLIYWFINTFSKKEDTSIGEQNKNVWNRKMNISFEL